MPGSIADRTVLNNGVEMPRLGFGVLNIEDGPAVTRAVLHALELGYRSVDTASVYGNERGVGAAIRRSGIPRGDVFLTTKVWNDAQRQGRTVAAFDESLDRLGLEYVDLYLIHWPVEGCYVQTWQAMEEIHRSGRARAIGVCNFMPKHLEELLSSSAIVPGLNQVEFHPLLVQAELMKFCRDRDIRIEAWGPLMKGKVGQQQAIVRLAGKYRKTPAQIVLRWDWQHEVIAIPRSANPEHIAGNADIFDFELSDGDMRLLDNLNEGRRFGPDPCDFDF